MNILIADAFPETLAGRAEQMGHTVSYMPDLGSDDLPDCIQGINVLVVRSTLVTRECVNRSDDLSLVIRAGSGVNTIDLAACAERGIFVSNCPGLNSVAVAELTMAHILSLDRNIPDCVADLRNGIWNKAKYAKLSRGLKGLRLGIIGFGNIGREVARRAEAFEMKIMVFDPHLEQSFIEMQGADYCASVGDLCAASDIITVHVPLSDDTEGLLDSETFDRMKQGAYVINTSRGSVIDERAFLKAAGEKGIRCGFDVFPDEPGSKSCPYTSLLASSPCVYGTHHIGASTQQAQIAVAQEVLDLLRIYGEGGRIRNCVNLETSSRARAVLAVRHYDRVGVLAEIFRVLKDEQINVENMENIILKGEDTACARIKIDKPLSDIRNITEDKAIRDDIIHVSMYDLK